MVAYVEKNLKHLKKQFEWHQGEWITQKAAEEYQNKVLPLWQEECQDIGERRKIRMELEEKYGLTELEAINILNGHHIPDIIRKYEIIREAASLAEKKDEGKSGRKREEQMKM